MRESPRSAPATVRVSLVGGFAVHVDGALAPCPQNVRRLIAFLAVRDRPQRRAVVAANLWLDTTDDRAGANLRTTLWRGRQVLGACVIVRGDHVALAPAVDVDLRHLLDRARQLIEPAGIDGLGTDPTALLGELLPDWDEEWITFERLRTRQLCVHALESLCRRLSAVGRSGEAVDAGLVAVAAEPLRESAQRVLIEAHLAEGNVGEARRQYDAFRALMVDHFGLEPSPSLRDLVGSSRPLRDTVAAG